MRLVSLRVSTPARPTTPRAFIQASRSPEAPVPARQLAAAVGTSRKTAPRAVVRAPPHPPVIGPPSRPNCSVSCRFTPVLPMWGKVKVTIWAM